MSFTTNAHVIPGMFGYESPQYNTCGPASMATVMDYYGIGWSDIPKSNGHYDNDAFVRRIMQHSGAPDTPLGVFGTTPMRIEEYMQRVGLKSVFYSGGPAENTMNLLIRQININRPVFVLIDYGQLDHSHFELDWQVAYKYNRRGVYTKISTGVNQDDFFSWEELAKGIRNNFGEWDQTIVTT